jgi:hypothetical protein
MSAVLRMVRHLAKVFRPGGRAKSSLDLLLMTKHKARASTPGDQA